MGQMYCMNLWSNHDDGLGLVMFWWTSRLGLVSDAYLKVYLKVSFTSLLCRISSDVDLQEITIIGVDIRELKIDV